jgi:hypothetical protein
MPRSRQEDNIKIILKEIESVDVGWLICLRIRTSSGLLRTRKRTTGNKTMGLCFAGWAVALFRRVLSHRSFCWLSSCSVQEGFVTQVLLLAEQLLCSGGFCHIDAFAGWAVALFRRVLSHRSFCWLSSCSVQEGFVTRMLLADLCTFFTLIAEVEIVLFLHPQFMSDTYIHSPIRLHGAVLN